MRPRIPLVCHGLGRNDGQGWNENFDRPAHISPQVIRLGSPIPCIPSFACFSYISTCAYICQPGAVLLKPRRQPGSLLAWAVSLSSEGWFPVAVAGRFPKAEKWPANGHKFPDGEADIPEINEVLA